jgi:hypothetical protein
MNAIKGKENVRGKKEINVKRSRRRLNNKKHTSRKRNAVIIIFVRSDIQGSK